MQKKLTVLFAFAIFVLMFALSPNTASAKCVDGTNTKNGKPCGGGGSEVHESALLSLGGPAGMTMLASDLPVTVSRDTDKWLSLVNGDFNNETIRLQFDVSDCFEAAGVFAAGDVTRFKNELKNFTVIYPGFLQIKRDRKKGTGVLFIDYMGGLGGNVTQITFPGYFSDTYEVSDEMEPADNIIEFTFTGTIYLRQGTPGGAQTDPQLGCNLPKAEGGTGPEQKVTVTLDRSAP